MAPLWRVNQCNRDCTKVLKCPPGYHVNKAHTRCVHHGVPEAEETYTPKFDFQANPTAYNWPEQKEEKPGIIASLLGTTKPPPPAPPPPPAGWLNAREDKRKANWEGIKNAIAKARAARLQRERQSEGLSSANIADREWRPIASGADEFGGGRRRRRSHSRRRSSYRRSSSRRRRSSHKRRSSRRRH